MSQDLSKVKGFNKLLPSQKELLIRVHKKHLDCIENKERWEVKSVTWEGSYLRVTFNNGEWLHYTASESWY